MYIVPTILRILFKKGQQIRVGMCEFSFHDQTKHMTWHGTSIRAFLKPVCWLSLIFGVLKTPPSLFSKKFAAVLRRFDIFSGKEIYIVPIVLRVLRTELRSFALGCSWSVLLLYESWKRYGVNSSSIYRCNGLFMCLNYTHIFCSVYILCAELC